ncbi:MAG TPA: hypothetical protein VGQ82_06395 [Chthoniobacterales bacterium]|nr:hypothetical protein [Chthoniobacterales bacterium]
MRSAAAFAILSLLAAAICHGRQAHCTLRLHAEANAHDGSSFSTQIRSQFSGQTVAIEKMPVISEHDVVAFQSYRAADGSYGVLFQLDDHGRLALDSLSVDRRGTLLFVFVNGRPITELAIDRRVSDGKVYIASGLTANDIELMKKEWPRIGPRKN